MTTYITDGKKLKTAIQSIARRGKKLDADIHRAAMSCAYHAMNYGDTSHFSHLVNAMPKSSRRVALCVWAEAYFPMTIDRKDATVKLRKGREDADWQMDIADAQPFWDYSKEKAEPVTQKVESIRSYLEKMAAGGSNSRPASPEARTMSRELIQVLDRMVASK